MPPPDRRTPGLSSLALPASYNSSTSRPSITAAQYASHGAALRSSHLESLRTQLSVFQSLLQQFSQTHSKEIRQNPQFRAEFARMCNAVGVDPLLSSSTAPVASKGISGKLGAAGGWLGGSGGGSKAVSDFYNELALRIVEICRSLRSENGGLVTLTDLQTHIRKGRAGTINNGLDVSEEDIQQALRLLKPLSAGIASVTIGRKTYIRSVPKELATDQSAVLEAIQVLGYVSVGMLQANLGWTRARAKTVVGDLVEDGLVWVDEQAGEEKEYWSPAFIGGMGDG